jgi:hypothetical protein
MTADKISQQSAPVWDPPPNPEAIAINSDALNFWRSKGYYASDCFSICKEIDGQAMAVMVTLNGSGEAAGRITSKTWERQEGHYTTVSLVLNQLARHPFLKALKGDFIVWLEDGMWKAHNELAARAPIFAFGRERNDPHTLLMPDPSYLGSAGYGQDLKGLLKQHGDLPWSARIPTIYFRGAATGLGIESDQWRETARGRLVTLARRLNQPHVLDAKLTRLKHLPLEQINIIINEGLVDNEVPFEKFCEYRYLVDADGYACAWRSLFLKLASGSLVLKVDSPFEQWYYRRLKPWHHFIPLAADLSDLEDSYRWLRDNDNKAQEIARSGDAFIRSLTLKNTLDELAFSIAQVISYQLHE